eukprot:5447649-Alexandrium_andersonii.AAC.1
MSARLSSAQWRPSMPRQWISPGLSQASPSSARASKTWSAAEWQSSRAWRCSRCHLQLYAALGPD